MLPGIGSFQSAKVRNGMRRRGSGSIRRRFFERVTERGARNSRSIVAALIESIFARIISSSFKCPLRSKAGSKIGNKAFRRLPQTRSEASHNTIRAPAGCLVVNRWTLACPTALHRRLTVKHTDRRLLVIAGARNELLQNPTLLFACSRPITTTHCFGEFGLQRVRHLP